MDSAQINAFMAWIETQIKLEVARDNDPHSRETVEAQYDESDSREQLARAFGMLVVSDRRIM